MFIKELKLNDFRNYRSFVSAFGEGFNIIYGENGQGKTNLIEAVFVCATGKSHRTSQDVNLINAEADRFCIDLLFQNEEGEKQIQFRYNKQKQKVIQINEINIRKIGELMGHLKAVLFSPEDLQIIKQGPALRRRFVDITLSQISPSYFYDLQQYHKTLTQRNALLKQIKKNRSFIDTLEIWNHTLYSYGSHIIHRRETFAKELGVLLSENHGYISGGKEKLLLQYEPSVSEDQFLTKLNQAVNQDIERETTMYGPHRDDFDFILNDKSLKLYGSQGQQRTAVLSAKLSEINIIQQDTGETPILLLDDVLSELDQNRQQFLFEKIENIQTFITCTEKSALKNRLNSDIFYFRISNGVLV